MSATRPAPVASVLASSAMATFPPARRSPMMPEPTTVASSSAVPRASATNLRAKGGRAFADCAGCPASGRWTAIGSSSPGTGVLRTAPSSPPQSAERGVVGPGLPRSGGLQGLEELLVEGGIACGARRSSTGRVARRRPTPTCAGTPGAAMPWVAEPGESRRDPRRRADLRPANGGCGRASGPQGPGTSVRLTRAVLLGDRWIHHIRPG